MTIDLRLGDWTGKTQNVMATLNATSHTDKERAGDDFYATPPSAVEALLGRETFSNVWECACGQGHVSEVLKKHGILDYSSDLIDRGYGDQVDFLASREMDGGDIVTNPPFSKSAEFVYKAMSLLTVVWRKLPFEPHKNKNIARKLATRKYHRKLGVKLRPHVCSKLETRLCTNIIRLTDAA